MGNITKELRNKSTKELLKMKSQLGFDRIKASSSWGLGTTKDRTKPKSKGFANKGDKTSLRKDIRRTIAKINTILREREIAENKTNGK